MKISYSLFPIFLIFSFVSAKAQTITHIPNYQIADSLFSNFASNFANKFFINFAKNTTFQPDSQLDSLTFLSLSPTDFKNHIKDLEQKQLMLLDSFAISNVFDSLGFDSLIKSQLVAKIIYQNNSYLLQHPILNNFFEVQQNEEYSEQIKSFYRISYKDYSLFLDSLEINNENYLPVNEYVTFLDNYLSYQELRFHIFNSAERCTQIDKYWLARLLFTGKVRRFMATRVVQELQKSFSAQELQTVLKDYNQKFTH
jgi:hypothetical protein